MRWLWGLLCLLLVVVYLLASHQWEVENWVRRLGEGPAAAWSLPYGSRDDGVVAVGGAVVVATKEGLVGVRRSSGEELWRRQAPESSSLTVAGSLVVLRERGRGAIEVVDPASGVTRWSAPRGSLLITRDAVYVADCCQVVKRGIADGRVLWRWAGAEAEFPLSFVGGHAPYAPDVGGYLPVKVHGSWALLDTATGAALAGRWKDYDWYAFAVGRGVAVTDNRPPDGDPRCTVRVHLPGGRATEVFTGRHDDGRCTKLFARAYDVLGAGGRIAVSTQDGRVQLFDLATGRAVWTDASPGVPIDGDGRTLLVGTSPERGPVRLLDLATGRVIFSVPGLTVSETSVSGGLVAVNGEDNGWPTVFVHRIADGKQVAHIRGRLVGLGEDWVAVDRAWLDSVEFIPVPPPGGGDRGLNP
ncbi:MAG: PQQ-binding-like beta-propeller repeat protein [Nonomuraea sp.]|nr:PQQ-binding-like beta-propeller repeat protein [Nonomuraea sp.]